MVNANEIVNNIKKKLETMSREEQLDYLKNVGFPVDDFIFNDQSTINTQVFSTPVLCESRETNMNRFKVLSSPPNGSIAYGKRAPNHKNVK